MNNSELTELVVNALDDLKGKEIHTIDVEGKSSFTDIIVIVSGGSGRQLKAMADNVVEKAKEKGVKPLGVEGLQDSGWILIDLGDVVVHVMLPETRDFYNLEKLWGEASPAAEA